MHLIWIGWSPSRDLAPCCRAVLSISSKREIKERSFSSKSSDSMLDSPPQRSRQRTAERPLRTRSITASWSRTTHFPIKHFQNTCAPVKLELCTSSRLSQSTRSSSDAAVENAPLAVAASFSVRSTPCCSLEIL